MTGDLSYEILTKSSFQKNSNENQSKQSAPKDLQTVVRDETGDFIHLLSERCFGVLFTVGGHTNNTLLSLQAFGFTFPIGKKKSNTLYQYHYTHVYSHALKNIIYSFADS